MLYMTVGTSKASEVCLFSLENCYSIENTKVQCIMYALSGMVGLHASKLFFTVPAM